MSGSFAQLVTVIVAASNYLFSRAVTGNTSTSLGVAWCVPFIVIALVSLVGIATFVARTHTTALRQPRG